MTLLSAVILLFLVMDPLGNIPLFLAVLTQVEPARQFRVLLRELVVALVVLLVFLLAGRYLVEALQISEPALSIAGGIILFLIALRMIFPSREGGFAEIVEGEPLIVPLAVPFVAGPSAMATVLLLASRSPDALGRWVLALSIAWVLTAVILLFSVPLSRLLGNRGLIAVQRLMGMILTTIAVQMLLGGIGKFLGSG